MPVDLVFILATAAFGFGTSLATYRFFALRNGWPMGDWHRNRPGLPIAIGVVAAVWSFLIALGRGGESAWVIPLFGLIVAAVWTGLFKVGSQVSLLLAPVATVLLALTWVATETPKAIERRDLAPASPRGGAASAPAETGLRPGNDPANPVGTERDKR